MNNFTNPAPGSDDRLPVLLVSPYHGGSHQAWAVGWQKHSRHNLQLLTLPARFWKWRMHGGAVTLARRFLAQARRPAAIVATDMLDLTTFLALTRQVNQGVPTVLYMHENQLTYPLPADGQTGPMRRQHGERDLHYGFVNYASMLAADEIWFNSAYHRQAWLEALPRFLRRLPEHRELASVAAIRRRSQVLPPGIDWDWLAAGRGSAPRHGGPADETLSAAGLEGQEAPLILWNQRWEYDKNPADFFATLLQAAEIGADFRLALCGQQFGRQPAAFETARARLDRQLVHVGFASPARYRNLLWQARLTLSTAAHEFFGISVLEAVACETFPILPTRLSYPELIPTEFHPYCLYENETQRLERLLRALTHPAETTDLARRLAPSARAYAWSRLAPRYDARLTALAA